MKKDDSLLLNSAASSVLVACGQRKTSRLRLAKFQRPDQLGSFQKVWDAQKFDRAFYRNNK